NDFEIMVRTGGSPEATLIGINEASTFNGFCARHDRETFRPLEAAPFNGSREQCFLLLYRAWARETYTKQAAVSSIEIYREADKGRAVSDQHAIQSFVSAFAAGLEEGLTDVLYYKAILDRALIDRAYETVRSLIFWFDSPPDILFSGATYPYSDFGGTQVQFAGPDPRPAPLAASLLTLPSGSAAVFSWLRDSADAPSRFLASLRAQDRLGDAIVRFAFSAFENVFARPSWWEALPEADRQNLIELLVGYMNPVTETRADHLADDGRRLTTWSLARITEV
ncbi:MAG: hypothetical protein AUI63_07285, partial [Gemmatimonadetes bacterium 13_1_40CM_2_60_3]